MGHVRSLMLIAALLAPLPVLKPLPALAVEADDVVAQLRAQGFKQINVSRTFLGRVKIEAQAPAVHREIVLNPKTGEILRDYTDAHDSDNRYAGSDRSTALGSTTAGSGLTGATDVGTASAVGAGISSGAVGGVGVGDATASPGGSE
ncbi:hypothetical protein C8J30_10830 [Rhodobacter viridis]|uniref:PepSY domain-containing protein n=1 Tax=Rhodobacter viridis TaxID=1054202 RepID=A0A318U0G3_9RHOB|nr:hypothetical protein [Rhodobacter viridis]PYF09458.1 hypothetical protein C8J30_10830 [Rhodobacter viridis]